MARNAATSRVNVSSRVARIDETLHLRSDKVFANEGRVELQGRGGRVHNIEVIHPEALSALDLSRCFVYLNNNQKICGRMGLSAMRDKAVTLPFKQA